MLLGNAGHFDVEIWKPDLEDSTDHMEYLKQNIQTYVQKDGRRINILGEWRLTNLACADGHPIEIMDLSTIVQRLGIRYDYAQKMGKKHKRLDTTH